MLPRVSLLLLLPLFAACGGSDAQCVIDTDCPLFNRCSAQQCVPVGGDAGVDTGTPTDSSVDTSVTDTGMDSGPGMVGSGNVTVSQTPLPMMMASHSMSAGFARTGGASICTTTEGSPCVVVECVTAPPMDAGMPDAGMMDAGDASVTAPHAGQVDLTGGLVDLTITPGGDGIYPPATGTGFVYSGGETLNVAAAGDEVPAFDESVSAPFPIVLTEPSLVTVPIAIDRTMDFTLNWTTDEPAPGDAVVTLTGFEVPPEGGSRSVTLSCTFDGGTANGTIPSSALMNLPGGGATGSFSVATRSTTDVTTDGWTVTVNALYGAVGDTGGPASATTTYP